MNLYQNRMSQLLAERKDKEKLMEENEMRRSLPMQATPGPGSYTLPDEFKSSKGYSFGNKQNDELKIKLGYDPLHV